MSDYSVCVFCGSRLGAKLAYEIAAKKLGQAIADHNWRLVFGAGDVGLMGAVARAVQNAGGDTFGVIPEHLFQREVAKQDLSSFIITENMHERKKVMFMNSDALVVLPGGAGSLDEFFEVLTWRQLALHKKPIFLLNCDGYWQPLLDLLDHTIELGFADESLKSFLQPLETVEELVDALVAARSTLKS